MEPCDLWLDVLLDVDHGVDGITQAAGQRAFQGR